MNEEVGRTRWTVSNYGGIARRDWAIWVDLNVAWLPKCSCSRQFAPFLSQTISLFCTQILPVSLFGKQSSSRVEWPKQQCFMDAWMHWRVNEWRVKMQLDLNENDWHSTLQKQKIHKRTGNYCQSEIPQSLEDLGVEGRKWRMMWDYMEIWNDQPTDSPLSNTVNRYAIHSSTFSVQSKYSRVRSDLFSSNFSSSLSLPLLELHRIFQSAIWYKARSRF